ncbi:MAG: DMT family transporter [Lachnospiraceae bacterium]|nr:DMT family transporter [Lachnospiraceae bacterium]
MTSKNKGILFILMAGVGFASMTIFSRLSGDLPTMQKALFRNLFAALIALFMLLKNKKDFHYEKEHIPTLFIRSLCGTCGIICNFYAVDHMIVSDANILNKVSPFAAVLFSLLFLSEKISFRQICTLIGAFLGALLVIRPSFQFEDFAPGCIGLLGGIMAGAAYTAVRYLGKQKCDSMKIVFFFSVFSCVVILPGALYQFKPMSYIQVVFLILCGTSAALGQICITTAYKYAPASEISIYDYFQIFVAAILGFFIFGQTPDKLSFVGYFIIFCMSFLNWIHGKKSLQESEIARKS